MSRIGKKSITLPEKVKVDHDEKTGLLTVEGPKGRLSWTLPRQVSFRQEGSELTIGRDSELRQTRALHGLSRSLVNNMVEGVTKGFQKKLIIEGVGFKAAVAGSNVNLSLGKSHPILHPIPSGITVTVQDNTKVTVDGIDKQLVGQVAADIRSYYPPEPYKGKGVRYDGEIIVRKQGKSV